MTISPIDPSRLTQIVSSSPLSSSAATTPAVDAEGDDDGSGAAASVSPLAQYLSQLQQLQQSNPTEFTSVLTDIANKLQAAGQQDGGSQGQALAHLASRVRQAAQTGDLSALQPAHHHHHHRAAGAYQQTGGQTAPAQASGQSQSGSAATDVRSQALDIIGQVLTQDLGTSVIASGS